MNQTTELKTLKEWGTDLGKKVEDLSSIDPEELIEVARVVGEFLVTGEYKDTNKEKPQKVNLKVNQIRRFLDAVRSAEAEFKQTKEFSEARESIIALRPKLAYAAGREERVRPLMNVLNPAMKSGAQSPEKFKYLVRLIEGIIAYHKFYGGGN